MKLLSEHLCKFSLLCIANLQGNLGYRQFSFSKQFFSYTHSKIPQIIRNIFTIYTSKVVFRLVSLTPNCWAICFIGICCFKSAVSICSAFLQFQPERWYKKKEPSLEIYFFHPKADGANLKHRASCGKQKATHSAATSDPVFFSFRWPLLQYRYLSFQSRFPAIWISLD